MQSFFKLENFINSGKNFYKLYFFLVVFLCLVKIPSLVTSDIQPWDEGMYATRVLSIHQFGDFLDQSSHSVGGFYSASHPPLLIWIAYVITLVFGTGSAVFKFIIFFFALGCVFFIMKTGQLLFSPSTGFYAGLIFTSNIIFAVFSQRFQLDIPYTFFILVSFYFYFKYIESADIRFLIISGVAFGCCLMTKILVGLYIPLILFISFFLIRNKTAVKFKSILTITVAGVLIALPWHIYMLMKSGSSFTDYFFGFHIYNRAIYGVEHHEKNSGLFYHVNYLLSIIPYSVLAFVSFVQDLRSFRQADWKKIFLNAWFITGLIIITFFKTKLEVYVLLILLPACYIIPLFINSLRGHLSNNFKTMIIMLTLLNILWFATESVRPELKQYLTDSSVFISFIILAVIVGVIFFISKKLSGKIELKKLYYIFILIVFLAINFYYLLNAPDWINRFKLAEIKNYIDKSGVRNITYISSDYRYNPQFSYYFNGLNLGWENRKYDFELIDTLAPDDDFKSIKSKLISYSGPGRFIIIEKDGINRAPDYDPQKYIPSGYRLVFNKTGYKLYEKTQ